MIISVMELIAKPTQSRRKPQIRPLNLPRASVTFAQLNFSSLAISRTLRYLSHITERPAANALVSEIVVLLVDVISI